MNFITKFIDVFTAFFPYISVALGLILGSFYNVCIHRFLSGENIIWPGSHCPKCKHSLSWWENIPLFSYSILMGRCRSCKGKISLRYPLVEAISGGWALVLALKFGVSWEWLVFMAFGGAYIVASFIDFQEFILPDIITYTAAALSLPAAIFLLDMDMKSVFLGALIGAGTFWLLQLFYRVVKKLEGLGTGDIKLMLSIGALTGWQLLPVMIFLAAASGLVASLFYLRLDASKGMQTAIPFGPFLCFGAMLTFVFGNNILNWLL